MRKLKKISLLILPLAIVAIFGTGIGLAISGPELSIPSNIPASSNSKVNVPISLTSHGNQIASMAFSIDYDENWLEPDTTNALSMTWNLPPGFAGGCSNDFADLEPLSSLTQLHTLSLEHAQINDITALSGLIQLVYLYLDGNEIVDLNPLSNMTQS